MHTPAESAPSCLWFATVLMFACSHIYACLYRCEVGGAIVSTANPWAFRVTANDNLWHVQ
jgi:hypothetical protein